MLKEGFNEDVVLSVVDPRESLLVGFEEEVELLEAGNESNLL